MSKPIIYNFFLKFACVLFIIFQSVALHATPSDIPMELYLQKTRLVAYEHKVKLLEASLNLINAYKLNLDESYLHQERIKQAHRFNQDSSRIIDSHYMSVDFLNNSHRKINIKFAIDRFRMAKRLYSMMLSAQIAQTKLDLPFINELKIYNTVDGSFDLKTFFDETIEYAEKLSNQEPDELFNIKQ